MSETLRETQEHVRRLEAALGRNQELLRRTQDHLFEIYTSEGWRVLKRLYAVRNRLLPPGSRRQHAASALLRSTLALTRPLLGTARPRTVRPINAGYAGWIVGNEPTPSDLDAQRHAALGISPTLSILVPLDQPPPRRLRALVDSVLTQTYARWELCLSGAAHERPGLEDWLRDLARREPRVRLRLLRSGTGLSGHLNAARAMAGGDYLLPLAPTDRLAPFALHAFARAINDQPDADFLYGDEDRIDGRGRRSDPVFKPDWSPDTLRGHNYVGSPLCLKHLLFDRCGGARPGFDGAEDYDLTLRASERAARHVHVPQVLCHRRRSRKSPLPGADSAWEAGRRALADHLERLEIAGEVAKGPRPGTYQTTYRHARRPLLSIIIPSHNGADLLATCVRSVRQATNVEYEILIVENGSTQPEVFALYDELRREKNVRLLTWSAPFNYAAVNNFAVTEARGELLLFLNNDIEAINADWLERLVEHALRPEVGAVGAKLYYPDGTIQHGGIVVGILVGSGHAHRHHPGTSPGHGNRLLVAQNVSAVTAACLMMRHDVFREVGGFDEDFVLAFNDVDLCLKVRERGYRLVWTPHAQLYHHESKTRGLDDTPEKQVRFLRETQLFQVVWGDVLKRPDPHYSPNLTREREDFSLGGPGSSLPLR